MAESIPNRFFEKLKNGQETQDDHLEFFTWMNTASEAEIERVFDEFGYYFEHLADDRHPENEKLLELFEKKINHTALWPSRIKKIAIAASLIITASLGYHFFHSERTIQNSLTSVSYAKIVPGSKKAILVLGNGSSITLDAVKNGTVMNDNHVMISKSKTGQLVYDDSKFKSNTGDKIVSNAIYVPRGGEYQLILPDGSKVWLNAQSSLKYPVHFEGKERHVELSGEAYFEVTKDRSHPFKVSANGSEVKVLGTHFNVMAYKDETSVKTTLLEGSVRIIKGAKEQLIIPGQQAIVNQDIHVISINVQEAVEWKNGNFNFSHENLVSIMRKISRWYDVSVDYQGNVTHANFVGTVPKSADITQVLKYLELTGLAHFKITERRITVMP